MIKVSSFQKYKKNTELEFKFSVNTIEHIENNGVDELITSLSSEQYVKLMINIEDKK